MAGSPACIGNSAVIATFAFGEGEDTVDDASHRVDDQPGATRVVDEPLRDRQMAISTRQQEAGVAILQS